MRKITRKGEVETLVRKALQAFQEKGRAALVQQLDEELFGHRVRFPLLEAAAQVLEQAVPPKQQRQVITAITDTKQIGAYPLAGKWLQLRLEKHRSACFKTAEAIIISGNEWYVCDIIGERVFGHALLKYPDETLPVLKNFSRHRNHWMVRVIGVAGHYAIKKGLHREKVAALFELLLALSGTTDFHTKKGIGWAAKTTAKFHPDIIRNYEAVLQERTDIRPWFRTKIRIGLSRAHKFAGRYS